MSGFMKMYSLAVTFLASLPIFNAQISKDRINYFIFDRSQNALVLMSNDSLPPAQWNHGGKIKILIHGWNSDPTRNEMEVLTYQGILILANEYAKFNTSFNIIVVDWTNLADGPPEKYFDIAKNVKPAGEQIAQFLMRLHSNLKLPDWSMIHLVGFSLGAHVSGVFGHQIQQQTGQKIARITGLDPAGPGFTEVGGGCPKDLTSVLDSSDAQFVDILHSNMGVPGEESVLQGLYGSNFQAGHADFYPNGGSRQSYYCTILKDTLSGCSHLLSVLYYALAIKEPDRLLACSCTSYEDFTSGVCSCKDNSTFLGELTSTHAVGKYYLKIDDKNLTHDYFKN